MLAAVSRWWWWCGRHLRIKTWTSGKRCPSTLTASMLVHLASSCCSLALLAQTRLARRVQQLDPWCCGGDRSLWPQQSLISWCFASPILSTYVSCDQLFRPNALRVRCSESKTADFFFNDVHVSAINLEELPLQLHAITVAIVKLQSASEIVTLIAQREEEILTRCLALSLVKRYHSFFSLINTALSLTKQLASVESITC